MDQPSEQNAGRNHAFRTGTIHEGTRSGRATGALYEFDRTFAVQAEFANKMAADYFAEGQKIVELMGEMAKEISSSPKSDRAHHS